MKSNQEADEIIEAFQMTMIADFPEALSWSTLQGVYPELSVDGMSYAEYAYLLKVEAIDLEKQGAKNLAALHNQTFDKLFQLGIMPVVPPELA